MGSTILLHRGDWTKTSVPSSQELLFIDSPLDQFAIAIAHNLYLWEFVSTIFYMPFSNEGNIVSNFDTTSNMKKSSHYGSRVVPKSREGYKVRQSFPSKWPQKRKIDILRND